MDLLPIDASKNYPLKYKYGILYSRRSLLSLDDEELYIEEFSYRDNANRITNLVSEQLKQPDFTFTGVSVS